MLTVRDWQQQEFVRIPTVVERRYCPRNVNHWITDGKKCPVCKFAIKTAVYTLENPDV